MATTRENDYRDLDLSFTPHPVTGDVVKKVGPDAVGRAIRNLVLTNFYDRPFRSYIGSNVQKLLFEPVTPIVARQLEQAIAQVIDNFEPRANVIGVEANVSTDQNGYSVKLVFSVNNRAEPYSLTVFLQRIR